MNLQRLIADLGEADVTGPGRVEVADLTDDSRRATPGCLFIARSHDDDRWRAFAQQAIAQGATAVVAPRKFDVPQEVTLIVPRDPVDQALAGRLAATFFDHPAEKLKLIGVTGTNGKTTVATLTQYLLNTAGMKCGLLGTVTIDTGEPSGGRPAELTTPGAIDLHRHFAAMVSHGCQACAMEVSSHALHQGRVDGLDFAAAVFTNLTQDHLDYHGTMEAYGAAKAKLFKSLAPGATAILNGDVFDDVLRTMLPPPHASLVLTQVQHTHAAAEGGSSGGATEAAGTPHHVTNNRPHQLLTVTPRSMRSDATDATLQGPWGSVRVTLPLVGRHNLSNTLQAVAATQAMVPLQAAHLAEAIKHLRGVPGRLEVVRIDTPHNANLPAVLVDYAHTPDALENVLTALRPLISGGGRLIVVFGCGGDRDKTKRPKMAKLAVELGDLAVLTSDNPRTENPQQILDDALAGVPPEARHKVTTEIDRAQAIRDAILQALPADTVLIAGKGHEDYQIIFDTSSPTKMRKIHFDDREHAAEALRAWAEQHGINGVKP